MCYECSALQATAAKKMPAGVARGVSWAVGRFQCGHALKHVEHDGGNLRTGACLAAHHRPVAFDEQHHGGFGGVVGILPHPGAMGVASLERGGHGIAQYSGGEPSPRGQRIQEVARGRQQAGGLVAVERRP